MSNTNPLYLHETGLKTLLSNLTKLQVLHLDSVDISRNGSQWGNAVLQVGPTFQELSMSDCGLSGNLPDDIFHLTDLTELDLSLNFKLSGQLSEFPKQSLLQSLNLAYTNLTGPIPDSIGNLQYLSEFDLFDCNFY
ncbi:Leucine-rich repeat receptor-like protein kinase PEPR1 [Carex littledalei]|uniref:Leucine-rich repeat receptor-like protein kinase PEPR1 n=1 Tax=Carex littledalei TaxID=544730 RepID=A0A833QLM9_9POAL|nr:Leucine-rich repeat receptor-like protein kinase PEPR1 [Carex littledalei]